MKTFNKIYEKSMNESDDELTDVFKRVNHEYLSQQHIVGLHDEIIELLKDFKLECFIHRKLFNDESESIDDPT
jgi:hypothetical protein